MAESDRRDLEIMKLKQQLGRYRRAFASMKKAAPVSEGDYEKRIAEIEKSIMQLNEGMQEIAKLLSAGLDQLSERDGTKEPPIQQSERGKAEKTLDHSVLPSRNVSSTKQPHAPSFNQLRGLAAQSPYRQEMPGNRTTPSGNPKSIKAATPLQNVTKEIDLPVEKGVVKSAEAIEKSSISSFWRALKWK
ncbi:hypothetical protein QWT69_01430 [Sporosarcina oncorhynchi]|uniref:Uncharacterized protein n=1 Tax=Sporosarcina oncorhynchi TaxID=3056444 RepID=A0ABZ0L5J0_9BACL|nr:hypothetical protein [Sporosarcina sp. T2O-4]WOV87811.1 hypothetical protein QWT69_01430 [Sporosarcina sp. T2O-4]